MKVLHRHIVVTCRLNGERVEVWIPADAGMGDKPDTAEPFVILAPLQRLNPQMRRYLTPEEMREVEKI